MSTTVPAVAYVRRSTEKQDASIKDQKEAIARYAAEKGYRIISWYEDDGISGDDTERRLGFLSMIEDASAGDFRAILVWDQDRFGRFSPQEAGYYVFQLSRLDIQLVTLNKGPIDWNDFTDFLTYTVNQHANNQFLKDLSRNVSRGHLKAAKEGSFAGGKPPYGYRIEGEHRKKKLVVDDRRKVDIVRRIFREFVEEGRSMKSIADGLNSEGWPSPKGHVKGWRWDGIQSILENPAYTGDYRYGVYAWGEYHTIHGDDVVPATKKGRRPKDQWIIHRDHHEGVIDRATFDRAQEIRNEGRVRRTPHTPETNPYLLSGLLRCGKCGGRLNGINNGQHRYYECGNFKYNGVEVCVGTTVREDTVLRSIAEHLRGWLGEDSENIGLAAYYKFPGRIEAQLPEAFRKARALLAPPDRPKADRKRMERERDKLRSDLEKARGNLVLLDPENIPAAQERIRQLDDNLAALEEELNRTKLIPQKDIDAQAVELVETLARLESACRVLAGEAGAVDLPWYRPATSLWDETNETIRSEDPARDLKRVLSRIGHIVCHTEKSGSGRGRGTRHRFLSGEIVVRPIGLATGKENPRRTD